MRKMLVICVMLVPLSAGGAELSKLDERKAAEEDICFARMEYAEADRLFFQETGGMYRPGSPEAKYAREKELKRRRLMQLEERYNKRFGQPFKGTCRP